MKKALRKNWIPKIVSLLLAIAIWFLIRQHLDEDQRRQNEQRYYYDPNNPPPKAIPVPEQ